jgi:hypothetical protein
MGNIRGLVALDRKQCRQAILLLAGRCTLTWDLQVVSFMDNALCSMNRTRNPPATFFINAQLWLDFAWEEQVDISRASIKKDLVLPPGTGLF